MLPCLQTALALIETDDIEAGTHGHRKHQESAARCRKHQCRGAGCGLQATKHGLLGVECGMRVGDLVQFNMTKHENDILCQ